MELGVACIYQMIFVLKYTSLYLKLNHTICLACFARCHKSFREHASKRLSALLHNLNIITNVCQPQFLITTQSSYWSYYIAYVFLHLLSIACEASWLPHQFWVVFSSDFTYLSVKVHSSPSIFPFAAICHPYIFANV